jgi:hypothetical protein
LRGSGGSRRDQRFRRAVARAFVFLFIVVRDAACRGFTATRRDAAARARFGAACLRPRRRLNASVMSAGISEGIRATGTPAASNAAILSAAVPDRRK